MAPPAQPWSLTPADEALIRDFLSRRGSLTTARRRALAEQIATAMRPRYDIGGDPEAERYLEDIIALPDGPPPPGS